MRHRHTWPRFVDWLIHHRVIVFGLLSGLLVGGSVFLALYIQKEYPSIPSTAINNYLATIPEPEPTKHYSQLTGALVSTETIANQAITAVMIENSPDARPQSGLFDAGLVFEARAEGGITRFMALYQESKPQLVGPVRSVRSVFVDWLKPFDASIAHVGGNTSALALVRNGSYRDIDQFFNSAYYWRATDRYAPHNVYTSFAKLDALNTAKGYTTSNMKGFDRTDGKSSPDITASSISVTISSGLFNSSYTYDSSTNSYARSQGGAPHLDREKGQITPTTIIVLKVDESTIMEDGYREKIDVVGSGKGYVFQNGAVTEITWAKSSRDAQISFTDTSGKLVQLNRGQTWITAIPNNGGAVSWK